MAMFMKREHTVEGIIASDITSAYALSKESLLPEWVLTAVKRGDIQVFPDSLLVLDGGEKVRAEKVDWVLRDEDGELTLEVPADFDKDYVRVDQTSTNTIFGTPRI